MTDNIHIRKHCFLDFDRFLFSSWRDKPNGKGKDEILWGVLGGQ